jgi:hypothetical protein
VLRIDRKLVFLDIEATSLDVHSARPWEVALIERWPGGQERRTWILVSDVDLEGADPVALAVGRFEERHVSDGRARWLSEEMTALWLSRRLTEGCTVVGSDVAGYDLPILAGLLGRHGFVPAWHHHPIDLVTWTQAREAGSPFATVGLTEGSYELSRIAGAQPPAKADAHTALGDALWARAWWDALTDGMVAR